MVCDEENGYYYGTVKEIAAWIGENRWYDLDMAKRFTPNEENDLIKMEHSIMDWYGMRRLWSPFTDVSLILFADEYAGGRMQLKRFLEYPSQMRRLPKALREFINQLMETDDDTMIFVQMMFDGGLRCSDSPL